jgi:hypothetical protein
MLGRIIRGTLTRESGSGTIEPTMMLRAAIVALLLAFACPIASADEGIVLGRLRQIRVTGRIVDSTTNRPVYGAQVAIEGPFQVRRADTGPEGEFFLTTGSEDGLGTISIAINHGDYQQKYLETVLRDALRNNLEARVTPGRVHVKAKRIDADVACGKGVELEMRSGGVAPVRAICEQGLTGVEVEVRRTRIAVLASGSFTVRVENGRLEVRDASDDAVELRVYATMVTR